ncbi:MAG: ABC transporter ATP-binding protein [Gammaproteobacteria bacterium]|nr:ABC transporter ATP-binding protein [Gammaproteobacteria bacterium]
MRVIIEARGLGVKFPLKQRAKLLKSFFIKTKTAASPQNHMRWFWALKNIEFTIHQGEVIGIIGRNGSGKTTLLRTIAGVYLPDEGHLLVRGTLSPLLSINAGFQRELSGFENIYLQGILLGFSKKEIDMVIDDIIQFAELEKFIYLPIKAYSSGMMARLGFSIAVHLKRDILLIDEILGVGDSKFRRKSQQKLAELIQNSRTTVLISSHNFEFLKKQATRILWLEQGELKLFGDPEFVIQNYNKNN